MIGFLDNYLPIQSRGHFPCSLSPETLAVNDCNYIVYTNIYIQDQLRYTDCCGSFPTVCALV